MSGYSLRDYASDLSAYIQRGRSEPCVIRKACELMTRLFETAGLEQEIEARQGAADRYARHLLYRDAATGFVIVAVVWSPGQESPVHDHGVWGVQGVYENRLRCQLYERLDDASREGYAELQEKLGYDSLAGSISYVLPPFEDIHKVANVTSKRSISLHTYGTDVRRCRIFDLENHTVSTMELRYDTVPQSQAVGRG